MQKNRRDPGELLFERYLSTQGYAYEFEPDLGIQTNPDYVVSHGAARIICEVKSFDQQAPSAGKSISYRTMEEVLRPVRNQISSAARQLKPLAGAGMPLVVVLTNPRDCRVPLSPVEVMSAMYGDLTAVGVLGPAGVTEDMRQVADRNGKLSNQHGYISAVVVVRVRRHADAWAESWLEQHRGDFPNTNDRREAFVRAMDQAPTGEDASVDVFETVSSSAARLPRSIFAGSMDNWWRPTSDGTALFSETSSPPAVDRPS